MSPIARCSNCHRPLCNRSWCVHCGLLFLCEPPDRQRLTRREWLQDTANIAQLITAGIVMYDRVRTKQRTAAIEIRAGDEITMTDSVNVTMPGVVALTGTGALTAIGTVAAQPASPDAVSFPPTVRVSGPVELRKALWQMRRHPKKLVEVPAGRLRWNQLRFPRAPDKWAI
jgi:hypothetical protein